MSLKTKLFKGLFLFLLFYISGCGSGAPANKDLAPLGAPIESTPLGGPEPIKNSTTEGDGGTLGENGPDGDGGSFDGRTPALVVSSPLSFDYQVQSLNSKTYATFRLTNTGGKPAKNLGALGLSAPYSFRHGNYPGFGGTCTNTLNGSESCNLVVAFQPNALTQYPLNSFYIVYDSTQASIQIPISLTGAATDIATLQFSNQIDDNQNYDFGTMTTGTQTTKTIRLNYYGALPATGVTFSALNAPFSIVSTSCGIEVSAACDLVIGYSGTGIGHFQQSLKVTYNNGSYAAESALILTGDTTTLVIPATLSLSDGGANSWGQTLAGQSYNKTFTVSRTGTFPATLVSGLSFAGPAFTFLGGSYPGSGGTCASTIISNCTIVLNLNSASTGNFTDTISLGFNNGLAVTQVSQSISAQVRRPAQLTISPNSAVDFGSTPLGISLTRSFTLTNSGSSMDATSMDISGLSGPFYNLGGCGGTLNSGSSCTFSVRFLPTIGGSVGAVMQLSYFNGVVTDQSLALSLSGQGSTGAYLIPSITSYDFGGVLNGSTSVVTVTLTHYGELAARDLAFTNLALPFGFSGGVFPGGGTCGSSISNTCTITYAFSPTNVGAASNEVVMQYNDGTGTIKSIEMNLSGTGIAVAPAVLTFNSLSYNYGSVLVGDSRNAIFTLSQAGNQNASALSISGLGGDFTFTNGSYPGSGGTCAASLSSGATCTIGITFQPSAIGSRGPQIVTMNYFNGLSTQQTTLTLNGTGTDVAQITAVGYSFGNVPIGQPASGNVVFTNIGTRTATSFSLNSSVLGSSFSITSTTCGTSLPANSSCSATIGFLPLTTTSVIGAILATFNNGSSNSTTSASILGTGIISITIAASNASFGSIPVLTTSDLPITITNSGSRTATALTLNSPSLSSPFSMTSTTCGSSLAGGSSCTATIHFAPTLATSFSRSFSGSYETGNGTVLFTSNISGTGTMDISIGASNVEFGTFAMGQAQDLLVTVTNNGTRAATELQFTNSSFTLPYSKVSTTCGSTLAGGSSCTMTLRFAPIAPGDYSMTWTGTYSNGISTVGLSGYAHGAATITRLVSANGNHTCARTNLGYLKCWGENNYGQLGLGDFINRGTTSSQMGSSLPAVNLGSDRYVTSIALGYWHTCVVLDNGSVKCWGANTYGQLGMGVANSVIGGSSSEMGNNLTTVNLGENFHVTSLALGYGHSCALSNQGQVKCWGQNSQGQLGVGDTLNRGRSPSDMGAGLSSVDLGGHSALQISANTSHTCAVLEDHTIRCWGNNFFGQLGTGDIQNRGDSPNELGGNLAAIDLGMGETVQTVAAGGAYTCALLTSGPVKCWGRNENGILGLDFCQDGSGNVGLCSDPSFTLPLRGYGIGPNQMGDAMGSVSLGSHRAVSLVASDSSTCVQLDNSSVKCWGENTYGQLGLGDTNARGLIDGSMGEALPTVSLGSGINPVQLTSGNSHSCALFDNGTIKCWGYNRFGGLGLGDSVNRGDQANQMGDNLAFPAY